MKHLFLSLLVTVAAGVILSGCNGGGNETPAQPKIAPSELTVYGDENARTIQVTSEETWVLSADKSWVKFSPAGKSGAPEPVNVELRLETNSTGAERKAVITVKTVSGATASMNLTQKSEVSGVAKGINSASDLVAFSEAFNAGESISRFYVDGAIKVCCDINMSGVEYVPAGTKSHPFSGTFDGGGFRIAGVSQPLFGYVSGASVTRVKYGNISDVIGIDGDAEIGGIACTVRNSTFTDCTFGATLQPVKVVGVDHPRIGGICGFASSDSKITGCVNEGNVIFAGEGEVGGLIGHNEGEISECTGKGNVLAVYSSDWQYGAGWACGYNKTKKMFLSMTAGGHAGDYNKYSSDPSKAPAGMYRNAVCYPRTNAFTLDGSDNQVKVDWTLDDYYAWTEVERKVLFNGVTYHHYDCDAVPRHVRVLEIDLTSPNVDLTTAYADDIVPNPNGNGNSNNGYNKRETLSMLCTRKRNEGQAIFAGINSGFFDSNDGFGRGTHIEEGQPVFVNNKGVQDKLTNHTWGFTVFTDGTASCGKKAFSGKVQVGGTEYNYYSVNDTILRNKNTSYQVNLYTSRYKKIPHTGLTNPLAKNVGYIVAKYTGEPMKVNTGWAEAKITALYDGLSSPLSEGPYLSSADEICISTSNATLFSNARVGETVRFRCDYTIDGSITKPIYTLNSSMYQFLENGKVNSSSVSSTNVNSTNYDPVTYPVVSQDGKKVWLVEVDGRQEWYSLGLKAYEMVRIAQKLGGYNMTRFDGGGSSCMWVYDASAGKGALVNKPSDSKGERSCMNYILIRKK